MKHPLGNHDTVEELGSLVQQAQQKAGTESKRGSGNCAESRSQLFANAVAKFFRDRPSTMLHSEGTLSNRKHFKCEMQSLSSWKHARVTCVRDGAT